MTYQVLSLVSLLVIRIGVVLRFVPFFGGKPLGILSWVSLSVLLASVLVFRGGPVPDGQIGDRIWFALALKEAFVGVFIGVTIRIVFSVLNVIGDLVRISTLPFPMDEESEERGGPWSKLFTMAAVGMFLLVDGHHAMLSALANTMACVPPGVLPGTGNMMQFTVGSDAILGLFSTAMAAGVMICAPILAAGLAAELFVGLVGRFFSGTLGLGGIQVVRLFFVQAVVIAVFGSAVSASVRFLQTGIEQLGVCGSGM